MPTCASQRFHATQASANACTKHHSCHFDTLSTLSRVMAKVPGQAGMPPAQPPLVPAAAAAAQAAPQQQGQAHPNQAAAHQRQIAVGVLVQQLHAQIRAQSAAVASTPAEVPDDHHDAEDVNEDQHQEAADADTANHNADNDPGDADSDIPSPHSSRRLETWIDHLQDPSSAAVSSVEEPPRALSSFGGWQDDDDDNNARNLAPTPEVEAQPVDRRQWYRDPVIYFLLVLGIAIILVWILMLCVWLVWRYSINAVEFEYLEKMRKRQFGIP